MDCYIKKISSALSFGFKYDDIHHYGKGQRTLDNPILRQSLQCKGIVVYDYWRVVREVLSLS